MLVTDISLCQFYREISKRAKNKNYVWIISLIARHADAKEMYEKLEQDWTSIDNLTNDKILFVFSTNLISNSNSFFHTPGRESYVGRMCPFAEMLNGEDIRDNYGDLWNLYDNFDKVDWKQKHSLAITEFAKEYGISEEQLPAIFVWNLQTSRYKIMPLKADENLYQIIRKVIIKLEKLGDEDGELGKNLVDQKEKIWDDVFDEYHGKMEHKKSNAIPAEHEKILKELLRACVRMQGNSAYYGSEENYRNDYIRDMLITGGIDARDQTRQGLSQNGKESGELDLLICENELPVTVIEALNLTCVNKRYIDKHIEKIFNYDPAGNRYNILLSYVTVVDFPAFLKRYMAHIEAQTYPYPLSEVEECAMEEISFTNSTLIKSTYYRSGHKCTLYHVCVLIP
ncbi:hypothetical protein [Enterocloster lavalensis]|uniref:hypothetical protein n=1 Tax=Enterocloster lavalensis TaxID=460384 RepID=UPI0023F23F22|nr:hypothetical protein [Enterocloster lavalensis]